MSGLDDWVYYNHAVIPSIEPKQNIDVKPLKDGSIWNFGGHKPLLARYTTDFDCGCITEWYYTIKDTNYDLTILPSKKKYNINKGRKCFAIKLIKPTDFSHELAEVCEDAFKGYSDIYNIKFSLSDCIDEIESGKWDKSFVFAAFSNQNNKLCGFYRVGVKGKAIELIQLKVIREYEKLRINYALVDGVLTYFSEQLKSGYYITNGCRNLYHKTGFNELLCENFGFRKAYCNLHIVYRPIVNIGIQIMYLFRRYINSISNKSPFLYKISAILEMERIARKCKNTK